MFGFLKRHCPHGMLRGIYGDEINLVGGFRLQCIACGRFLRGPVTLAEHRKIEWELFFRE
ncbi:hypothetical protein SEA_PAULODIABOLI_196 [Microbacterium phage PauloDiaboli]|nr:hypothetical protein SEA_PAULODIABOLI_196 [Microbacterium phage PauloDiaboli]QWY84004.1 hypothetical protein SEA_A3WALLY_197 [Microbacterium phage A3Wally]